MFLLFDAMDFNLKNHRTDDNLKLKNLLKLPTAARAVLPTVVLAFLVAAGSARADVILGFGDVGCGVTAINGTATPTTCAGGANQLFSWNNLGGVAFLITGPGNEQPETVSSRGSKASTQFLWSTSGIATLGSANAATSATHN
jgi:hypothetical protein